MIINRITRSLLATLLLAFSFHNTFAQVLWSEHFSDPDAAATNWVSGGTNEGTEVWKRITDPLDATFGNPAFAAPTCADGFFQFNSDHNGQLSHNVTLTGPVIDCSASTHTSITFWAQYMYYNAPIAVLEVSTDGGINWTTHTLFENLASEQMFNDYVTIDLPEANSHSNVRIRFRWAGHWEYSWKVDDIEMKNVVDLSFCALNPDAILCDNLDAYDPISKLGPQSAWWTTWFGAEGGSNDATVSTEQASSAPNSVKIVSTSPGGGLQSAILQLGGVDSAHYELKFKLFIDAGKTAYYDMRNAIPIVFGGNNLNVYFDSTGTGVLKNSSSADLGTFSFPNGSWFECKHQFDLDANVQTFWVNDVLVATSPFTGTLGGVLFMGSNAVSVFYIDDVAFAPYTPKVITVDDCAGAVNLDMYFGGATNEPQTTGIFDNTNATADPSDPPAPSCFLDGVPNTVSSIDGSFWYSFTGDGKTYHLETVPCGATNYIDNGDTQMAIFTGACGDFTELLCNEDLAGAEDYRAGLDIETVPGTAYSMLIDGWSDPASSFVASGEFCIQITKLLTHSCAEGVMGTFFVENGGLVCDGMTTGSFVSFDENSFVLPTVGPVHGMSWAVTTEPVPAGVWPPTMASYRGSFAIMPDLYMPNLLNDVNGLQQDTIWYFTPVIVGNAVDLTPSTPQFLHDLDITDACYFIGESAALFLLGELAPLGATYDVIPSTAGNSDGAINLTVNGGLMDVLGIAAASYAIEWSGPNSYNSVDQNITDLAAGTYIVTITDLSGCIEPKEVPIIVTATSAVKDPAMVKSLSFSPNPTSGTTQVHLSLSEAAEVHIEVLSILGQSLQTVSAGKVESLSQNLDLSDFANGTYFLRIRMDGEVALRRVVLQH